MTHLALCTRCPRTEGLIKGKDRADLNFEVHVHATEHHHWPIGSPSWTEGDDYWVLGQCRNYHPAAEPLLQAIQKALWVMLHQAGIENVDQAVTEALTSVLTPTDVLDVLRTTTQEIHLP